MTNKKTTEIVSEIVELLTPLDSAERARAVRASLVLLGEVFPIDPPRTSLDNSASDDGEMSAVPIRARTWMKQNGVSWEELQQVFHLEDGNVDVIAGEIPGKNKKEKTYNAYILSGLAKLFSTGNPSFDDKTARALCESSGCYDQANHSVTIKDRGNEFTGTKEKGWALTAPGLKRAGVLIKEMIKN